MDHDHTISFSFTTGSDWLRIVVVAGAVLVIAAALLRPAVAASGRTAGLVVTIGAACVALLHLLLADGLDMPQQAVVALLAAAAVPIAGARHLPAPVSGPARRVALGVVLAAAAWAGVELARAWLWADGPAAATELVDTAVLIGIVGLSWLVLCRPRSRTAAVTTNAAAWVLGNLVLAGVAVVAAAGIPAS